MQQQERQWSKLELPSAVSSCYFSRSLSKFYHKKSHAFFPLRVVLFRPWVLPHLGAAAEDACQKLPKLSFAGAKEAVKNRVFLLLLPQPTSRPSFFGRCYPSFARFAFKEKKKRGIACSLLLFLRSFPPLYIRIRTRRRGTPNPYQKETRGPRTTHLLSLPLSPRLV